MRNATKEEQQGIKNYIDSISESYDGKTFDELLEDENTKFVLTPWGCLYSVLTDYKIDVEDIPGRVGEHIVEDFMDVMKKAGYVGKAEENND